MDKLPVWCYVFFSPIDASKASFATHVPVRAATILRGIAEVQVIYSGHIDHEILRKNNIRAHGYALKYNNAFLNYAGYLRFIRKTCRAHGIAIVQNVWRHYLLWLVRLFLAGTRTRVLGRLSGVPISSGSKGNFGRRVMKRMLLYIEKRSLTSAVCIQALSHSLKAVYVERGVPDHKIVVLSQGVDTDKFRYVERSYPIEGALRMLYVGRIAKLKGLDNLIDGLALLSPGEKERIKLTIAGDGEPPIVDALKSKTGALGLEEVVTFLGSIQHDQVPSVMGQHDLLVLPSYTEGLPNVILEAMASGLPCLSNSVGEAPLLLENDRGILLDSNAGHEIAGKIKSILKGDVDLERLTKNAHKYIMSTHSMQILRLNLQQLIRSLLAEKGEREDVKKQE